jgi:hypothetical protein
MIMNLRFHKSRESDHLSNYKVFKRRFHTTQLYINNSLKHDNFITKLWATDWISRVQYPVRVMILPSLPHPESFGATPASYLTTAVAPFSGDEGDWNKVLKLWMPYILQAVTALLV